MQVFFIHPAGTHWPWLPPTPTLGGSWTPSHGWVAVVCRWTALARLATLTVCSPSVAPAQGSDGGTFLAEGEERLENEGLQPDQ